jgi:TatD DNase family protein
MSFSYIDAHTHLNFAAFDNDRDKVIRRALEAGVALVNVGTQKDTSVKAVELAGHYEHGVYATIGIHPIHTGKSFHDEKELGEGSKEFTSRGEDFDSAYYRTLAKHPKVIAIGECGLDYYRLEAESERRQKQAFSEHIALASAVNKPLMLHVRNGSGRSAYREALDILKREAKVGGDFHFFAGSWDEAKAILDADFHLSFTGVLTFANDYDEVVRNTPLDRMLAETDAPYVAPVPYRGKRNEPLYVKEVVRAIARIRAEDEEKVRAQVLKNAERLFGVSLS